MSDHALISLKGTAVAESAIQKFQTALSGNLIRPGGPDYETARHIWNRSFDKHPGLIVRCANGTDVQRAVEFARSNDLVVAVRGGGHSFAGHSTCDDGMVVDLSAMKEIQIDRERRTARAQAGVKVGEFDRVTQAVDLATTMGGCEEVGIAGFTLGGGQGLLAARYGLGCDNLIAVEVVTADGRCLQASADENSDLFWGMRGGAGNFGVATALEYRLHPISRIYGGLVLFPIARASEVLRASHDYLIDAPDELTTYIGLTRLPDGPVIAIAAGYCGDLDKGAEVLRPLSSFAAPLMNTFGPQSYLDFQHSFEAINASGVSTWRRSNFFKDLSQESIDIVVNHIARAPRAFFVGLFHYRGAVVQVGATDTAFPIRQPGFELSVESYWQNSSEAPAALEWTDSFWKAMRPLSTGAVYVNNLSDEGEERAKAAYGINYDRLVRVKNKYDPMNLFRLNQNIKPTA